MKTLPVGLSTLASLRERNAIYVDKTQHLHRLMTSSGGVYFLSRPRRFGKSLLIDTFAELFKGNKALFEGTWIAGVGRHDWQSRPVLRLDFSSLSCINADVLKMTLGRALTDIGLQHGVDVSGINDIAGKLEYVVRGMAMQGKIAVLIDEYDAPIINNILTPEISSSNRDLLREFYTTLKALAPYVYFVFLTGVSKFAKTSIFSGMNNVRDISMSEEYAALCGYTQAELESCFDDHLSLVAQIRGLSRVVLLDDMRFWYNGYRFSPAEVRVYNPFSILLFLEEKRFISFWATSGRPQFLVKLIKNKFKDFEVFEDVSLTQEAFDTLEPENAQLMPLFYQAGCITIKTYCPETEEYTFTYPNEEVRRSFSLALVSDIAGQDDSSANALLNGLRAALRTGDAIGFAKGLQSILATIPYNLHINRESYYHTLLHAIGLGIGGVVSEVATSKGRIDLVLQSEKHVFVIELKIDGSAEMALAQIKDRRYYEPFMNQGRMAHLIGLNLAFEEKLLTSAVEVVTSL